ncbi:MAG: nicotinamide-nucleotide amidohydrolase family protein [Rhodocyclaceae bacterium]|nr:nicotinamide-nucleotide amidohydrolase family protein [Rhodocyclaceae bacterium]
MSMELEALAVALGETLKGRGLVLATAESCTGGWAAQEVTAIAGSSAWFERGFVTYANAAKIDMLGVSPETLASFGAVSLETAGEMASGALAHSRADVALAITGIAGPSGGSPDKPVGTVCFAWCRRDAAPIALKECFQGDRGAVRRQAVVRALSGLLDLLEGGDGASPLAKSVP